MPKYDLSKKIINRDISRRDMIKGLGAAGVITTTLPLLTKRALAEKINPKINAHNFTLIY